LLQQRQLLGVLRFVAFDSVQWRHVSVFGRVTIFPEVGVEYRSRAYTRYYNGTTSRDAQALGQIYQPGAAVNPHVGALIETRLFNQ
jgi:outer membrane scaffolding protein for murein synthesis (MipA/OmpV family)